MKRARVAAVFVLFALFALFVKDVDAARAAEVSWRLDRERDGIVVYTRPKRAGFQAVQLRLTGDANPKIMPIDFINERGYRIETIAANSAWSSQP